MDGIFLSNSIDAFLNNDISTAIFMAYYAELRAVMSFFATEGIGIFKGVHYWFDQNGEIENFRGGTHDVSNKLFEAFSNNNDRNRKILSILEYDGIKFIDWLEAANNAYITPVTSILTKHWLSVWGFDLAYFLKDHNIRNNVSYRPQNINFVNENIDFQNSLNFILNIWKVTEPTNSNRTDLLDKYLLKNSLEEVFRKMHGVEPKGQQYEHYIRNAFSYLGKSDNNWLINFLTSDEISFYPELLLESKKMIDQNNPVLDAKPVIARAIILLRICSAATVDLFRNAGIHNSEMQFWWEYQGLYKGLCQSSFNIDDVLDLWIDMQESIDKLMTWCSHNEGICNIYTCRQDNSLDMWHLRQFQRTGLWATKL